MLAVSLSACGRRRLAVATLAATLVLGLLLFVCLAHALLHEPMPGHEDAMGGVVAFCLVLFTVLAPLALAAPALARSAKRPAFSSFAISAPRVATPIEVGARASPAWLQRFQN